MGSIRIFSECYSRGDTMYLQKMYDKFIATITSEELWSTIWLASLKIFFILLLSYTVVRVAKIFIKKVFLLRIKSPLNHSERRQKTISRLLQSIVSYVVYFSAIVAVLSVMNIKVAGLLAGAGIAGLAIGFGAQSLVKDVITGFFIIFEDQFGVGDYIKLNIAEGTVVEIGLRTTKIKGNTGEQFIIPNGSITDVINYSVNNSKALIDMQIGIDADIEKVEKVVQPYLNTLPKQYQELVAAPTFLGVMNVTGTEVTIRIIAETLPLEHYAISRIIRRDVKNILEKNGIPLATPKMMLYDRNGKGGEGE